MANNRVTVEGDYTTATLIGDESMFDEATVGQVQEMVDHESFTNEVVCMPDSHYGAGAVIGFTMEMSDKLPVSVVGMDIGCGVDAFRLQDTWSNDPHEECPIDLETFDEKVREAVPIGFEVSSGTDYHVGEDFPYEEANKRLIKLFDTIGEDLPDWFEGYDVEYFKELCKRTGTEISRAINSVGTLGSGNHFIELDYSENGLYVVLIHSGSRGIGGKTANFWKDKADQVLLDQPYESNVVERYQKYIKFDSGETTMNEALQWFTGGMGESFYDMDKIKADHEGEEIEEVRQKFVEFAKQEAQHIEGMSGPLSYLEGGRRLGYLVDMIFCQVYAEENRDLMMRRIEEATGLERDGSIVNPHNYISQDDGIIRKGAIEAYDGQWGVVPFSMSGGAVHVQGKGNADYNYSAPHGAGRTMSRTQAKSEVDEIRAKESMEGVFTTNIPLDEVEDSYKDPQSIIDNMQDSVDIIDRFYPLVNLKD